MAYDKGYEFDRHKTQDLSSNDASATIHVPDLVDYSRPWVVAFGALEP